MKRTEAIAVALLTAFATIDAQETMTFERAFELIDANNAALLAAQSSAQASAEGVVSAKRERLPDIDAALTLSYNGNILKLDRDFSNAETFSQPHFGNNLTVEARQIVYAGGAINSGIRMAEIEQSMTNTNVDATRDALRYLAVSQLLQLIEADMSISVYDSNIKLAERLIDDVNAKRERGMALQNDITRYELQRQTLLLGRRTVEDRRSIINYQLCNTLGLSTETRIEPDTTLQTMVESEQFSDWQQLAQQSSTAILQSADNVALAQQQLSIAKSERRPTIFVYAADIFNGPYTYDIPPVDNNFNIWQIGVGVSYKFGNLYKRSKNVRRADIDVRQRREQQQNTAEEVDNRMLEAFTLYRQAFEQLRTAQKSVELARENYAVVNDRYLNDLALVTDMTDAQNMLLRAELDEATARLQIVNAYYRMKYIAGDI